ncbi:winged helix-turn-helix domain-containing protein [Streptomyces sp. NPDC014864]|uniref:helix-turn-helix domain-containing protein n=1 Tax=Streptomyces sp. NPDC014864 TaxID=3364924 RepID=UPI0036FE905A
MTAPTTGAEDDARDEIGRLAEKIEDEVPEELRDGRGVWSRRRCTRSPPGGARCKLDAGQLRLLEAVLDAGPAASGWSDQCWTWSGIAEIVRRRLGVEYTLAGLDLLLHRIGWSAQVPSRKVTERDEAKIAAGKDEQWPVVRRRRRTWVPGSASRTKPARV